MRRLAAELGVAPNAIYSHVSDKSTLVDAVVDSLLADIDLDVTEESVPRDGLRHLMIESRRVMLEHGDFLPRFLSGPMRGPNASRLGEVALQLLSRLGLEGQAAVDALRVLLTYAAGSAAMDVPRLAEDDRGARWAASERVFGEREDLELMARNARALSRPPAEAVFERGLDWLLDGIVEAARPASKPDPRGSGPSLTSQ